MIQTIVGDAGIVFDVGAKHGAYSLEYLALFPRATVYAFEPAPSNFEVLQLVAENNPRLHVIQSAVLDHDGTADFHLNSHAGSHSILEIDQSEFPVVETIIVPTVTLDTFCADINHIDFLKIDTQGTDLLVLKGAIQLLRRGRIGVVEVEFIYYPYYKAQPAPQDIARFLQNFGMQMVALFPNYYRGSKRYADAIFSSRRGLM